MKKGEGHSYVPMFPDTWMLVNMKTEFLAFSLVTLEPLMPQGLILMRS